MMHILRFWIGLLTSLCLVGFAIAILISEIQFELNSESSTATVEKYTPNKILAKFGVTVIGKGGGTVIRWVGGQPIKATFRSYYIFRGPQKGDQTSVLYLPADPGFVKVDSWMQRYGPIAFPLVLAFAVAYWSGVLRLRSEVARGTNVQGDPPESLSN